MSFNLVCVGVVCMSLGARFLQLDLLIVALRAQICMRVKVVAPLLLLLFPSPRACAWSSVCELVVVAGWLLLVVVVGRFRGRSETPRHPHSLNLNGLLLWCCLTVPLSTLSSKSDSLKLR